MQASGSVTTVRETLASRPVLVLQLHPRRTAADRFQNVLSEIQENSALLNESEREGFLHIEKTFSAMATEALRNAVAQVVIATLRAAIGRLGEAIEERLFTWEEELVVLLGELLPPGTDVEGFLAEFEEDFFHMQQLMKKIEFGEKVHEVARRRLYEEANKLAQEIERCREEGQEEMDRLIERRLAKVEELTESIEAASLAEGGERERLMELARRVEGAAETGRRAEEAFVRARDRAIGVVERIRK